MTDTIGNYELQRLVATGGMAEVWIATQTGPGGFKRELAIKRILPHLARDERFTQMFLDEASIASKLTHPNIAQIYELGEDDDEYFIAMEFIDGMDLADILDHTEKHEVFIPIPVAARIVADVLNALHFAHEFSENGKALEVVHRDVSPHNVLISNGGVVKLVDFGVAKAVERHSKTQTGVVKGKLSYMAPEQVEQDAIDRRADIFSAGVVLYELLTNTSPFGRDLSAVSAILHSEPADPREIRQAIPWELVGIIKKSLEKKAEDRFQTAEDMANAIEEFLHSATSRVSSAEIAGFLVQLSSDDPGRLRNDEPTIPDMPGASFGLSTDEMLAFGAAETLQGEDSGGLGVEIPREVPPEEPRVEPRRIPTQTAVTDSENQALGTLVAIAVVLLVIAVWSLKDSFTGERPEPALSEDEWLVENTEPPETLHFDEDEAEDFEIVEEEFIIDDEIAVAWAVWGEYESTDQLFESRIQRIDAFDDIEPERYDPGDPAIVAVLDLPDRPTVKKRTTKHRVKHRVKRKKKSREPVKRKPRKKRNNQDLKRIDKVIPNF